MPRGVDITGTRIGSWHVIKEVPRMPWSRRYLCKCECGTEKVLLRANLVKGTTHSCGCNKGKFITASKLRHAMSETRFYSIWTNMMTRCTNKRTPTWKRYGARGISVSPRWHSFENFQEDMLATYLEHVKMHGEKNTSIERNDNDGNYQLDNCRWATPKEQANNRREVIRNKQHAVWTL